MKNQDNNNMLHITMEELLPVVGKLAGRYTAGESTSVTYEKAQQLMEAVLYCIREVEQAERDADNCESKYPEQGSGNDKGQFTLNEVVTEKKRLSAQQVYEKGLVCVETKVKAALTLYNEMQTYFDSYGNRCLYDTFIKAIPKFFKWYDIRFAPQDTILMLDYPVSRDLTAFTGIDRIYEYLVCIQQEQKLLNVFPRDYVIDILREYNPLYEDMIENIYEVVSSQISTAV